MDSHLPYGILLKNIPGYNKKEKKSKRRKSVKGYDEQPVLVPEGTLVATLSQAESINACGVFDPLHNYKCIDSSITLHCTLTEVKQLTCKQKDLLMGVTRLDSRLEVVCKLDWVDKLDIKSIVYVTIPTITVPVKGMIRFIGTLPEEVGIKFGIELLEKRGEGTSDGKFRGIKYFKCEPDCAVFVSMDNLTTKDVASFAIPIGSALLDSPIVLKNKVKIFDKLGKPVNGIVKWIGKNQQVDTLGIEVEKVVALADFPEHIQDEKYKDCFTVADGHSKLLLPANLVTKDVATDNTDDISEDIQSLNEQQLDENYIVGIDDETLSGIHPRPKYLTQPYRSMKGKSDQLSTLSSSFPQFVPPDKKPVGSNPHNLQVGAMIQFGNPPCYGIIKWIGSLPCYGCLMAGVEVEKPLDANVKYSDGWYQGVQYFQSGVKKGHFLPLVALHPDQRQEALKPNETSSVTQLYQNVMSLENQMKGLQSTHDDRLITVESTIDQLHHRVHEVNSDFQSMKEQIKTMEANINAVNEELRKSNAHMENQVSNVLQQLLDMHTINKQLQIDNDELKTSNAHLQNQLTKVEQHLQGVQTQLSLTQQQLIGIQSMVTHSRLWIVSHDQFAIKEEIGRGAWATVHKTMFRGNMVAAKCLHNAITAPETKEMFQKEMEMTLYCQHENIVTFLGATLEGHPVILMELMDISLRNAYEQESVRDCQKWRIFYDIANALHFLHTRSNPVIHRDVSSANVLLKRYSDSQWFTKLGDLGTARIQQCCTTPGPGTIAYAAPEASNPTQHSPKMDVYSYGILVVETLTTKFPYVNKLDTLMSSIQQRFPQYHQLVTSCRQSAAVRPTMHNIIIQLDSYSIATT